MTTIVSRRGPEAALNLMATRCGALKALLTRCQLQLTALKKCVEDAAEQDISDDLRDFISDDIDFILNDLEDEL